jgi:hypothetical protein
MKEKLLITLLLFRLQSHCQINASGEYISADPPLKSIFYSVVLNLKCDKTFSYINGDLIQFGTWRLQKSKKIILQVDSTIFDTKTDYKRIETTLRIRNEKLYFKQMTRHQFNKRVREIEKNTGEGQSSLRMSYRKKVNYYKRITNYTCK